jgi:hypothetical protein
MIYTNVLYRGLTGVGSPVNELKKCAKKAIRRER